MHPIPVRTIKFSMPELADFHPICIAGSSVLSYTHLAMSLLFSCIEPFAVKSFRKVLDLVQDDTLREETDRFVRQEAQHYQRHGDLNKLIFAQSYPGLEERYKSLNQDYEYFLTNRSNRFCIGYIEGFESYTTQIALHSLISGLYEHRKSTKSIAELFKWHMLEEIEHRNVAFDVYQHLYGNYLYRAKMCFTAQNHMFRFIQDCIKIMSSADVVRYGDARRITLRQRVIMGMGRNSMRLRTMLPFYTPHKYIIPDTLKELSDYFTKTAEQVR